MRHRFLSHLRMNHDEPKNFFSQLGQIGLNGGVFLAGGITQKTVVLVK
ncbi:hypothetical protein AAIH70_24955 [Neorhizobium sp. BT27B]